MAKKNLNVKCKFSNDYCKDKSMKRKRKLKVFSAKQNSFFCYLRTFTEDFGGDWEGEMLIIWQ